MKFRVWFRLWLSSFFKLLTVNDKKRKSEAQRNKEREERLKAKHSSGSLYRKKKRRKRRTGWQVQNERVITALVKFLATSFAILLIPIGLIDWGHKSVKIKRKEKTNGKNANAIGTAAPVSKKSSLRKNVAPSSVKESLHEIEDNPIKAYDHPRNPTIPRDERTIGITTRTDQFKEPDENTPKSHPKHESDRYIRKRMIIAGASYCEKSALETLTVGTYIDLVPEPDNEYDKNAVKLMCNGRKIGYISKTDNTAFATCLNFNRKIYGVITAVIDEEYSPKYEFETWFEN